jgi:hypothetical protein
VYPKFILKIWLIICLNILHKNRFIVEDLGIVTRQTASKYLDQLIELKLITLHKIIENFYINTALYEFYKM